MVREMEIERERKREEVEKYKGRAKERYIDRERSGSEGGG